MPIIDALRGYVDDGVVRFHMPGHKGGRSAPAGVLDLLGNQVFAVDVTNVPGMDDLHQAEGVIHQAEELAAEVFGAEETYFLVNGASCGMHALVLATCEPGDLVLVPRNLHRSLLSGLILSGASPVFYDPLYDRDLGFFLGVRPETIADALSDHPGVRAVFIVSPTYQGIASDLTRIADIAHQHGIPLLVDEAHGPHFHFHPDLPATALSCGADACVHGSHKTLSAFTQAAMLHVKSELIDRSRLKSVLCYLQSTSTSYLLLASLDATRAQMGEDGHNLVQKALDLADYLRDAIRRTSGLYSFDQSWLEKKGNFRLDRTKVTVSVKGLGITGLEAEAWLRKVWRIQMEMSDVNNVLALTSFGNTMEDVECLAAALTALAEREDCVNQPLPVNPDPPPQGILKMSPRAAFLGHSWPVPLEQAVGRIGAETITCYPPGIPVLVPGEVVSRDLVEYLGSMLKLGVHLQGPADPSLKYLRVVT